MPNFNPRHFFIYPLKFPPPPKAQGPPESLHIKKAIAFFGPGDQQLT